MNESIKAKKLNEVKYLFEPKLFTFETKVVSFKKDEIKKGTQFYRIELEDTIFHAKGGGQPNDIGKITSLEESDPNLQAEFIVQEVIADLQQNSIYHLGTLKNEQLIFKENQKVNLQIDKDRRELNSRLHSAGHLLSSIVTEGLKLPIVGFKGNHYPKQCFVEFEGVIENLQTQRDQIISKIQNAIDEAIANKLVLHRQIVSKDKLPEVCYSVPQTVFFDPVQVVSIGDFKGNICGGTHVEHIGEIGKLVIKKINQKKSVTRISYDIVD
ncbi:threonyl and alanyl tRNA synthetase second additional domain-containing protein [Anaeramoeba ignava]|uniref:Threonyl and alanyl tRNA synthetase second additional domain-containing protein n=1 Tax=Anaeramoeba ignava TaxID=1746090 RepID=A0A9Q0LL10_ANAIG|nr:threonyl and alanyl tRNA synthetase second additional domain-containing protein [Anaeramoeba ignava]